MTKIYLLFLSFFYFTLTYAIKQALHKGSKIGIIGSGVSGTFLSYHLSSHGFTDITVIEKHSLPAHICNTTWVDGNPIDVSIVYAGVQLLPNEPDVWKAMEPNQAVISPTLATFFTKNISFGTTRTGSEKYAEHLDKLNIHRRPVAPFPTKKWAPLFPLNQGIALFPEKTVTELIQIWQIGEKWMETGIVGVDRCIQEGFALPDETFEQWCTRNNLGLSGKHVAFIYDYFANVPAATAPACQVIAGSMNKWQAAVPYYLGFTLLQNPTAARLVPPLLMVKTLIAFENHVLVDRMLEGYCEVFYRTNKATKAKFKFNEVVVSVKSQGFNNIKVQTNKNNYQFDTLIFAIRPQDFKKIKIVNNNNVQVQGFEAFEQFSQTYYRSQVIKSTDSIKQEDKLSPVADEIINIFDPTYGTAAASLNGHLGGLTAPFIDEDPDTLILIGSSSSADNFGTNFETDLQKFMSFTTKEIYFDRIFDDGPNYYKQNDISDFYKWINEQQGNVNTGFYFTGEYISGHGVPENFHGSLQLAEKYFFNLPDAPKSNYYAPRYSSHRNDNQDHLQPNL